MASIEADSTIEAEAEFCNAEAVEIESGLPVPVVPVLTRTRWTDRLTRPDSSFVAHLMAIEQQCPQTRVLRRAQPSEAVAAYRSVEHHNRPELSGGRMRRSS
jgi:hypothetical protein